MAEFKFPRSPGVNGDRPFEDARGDNPFGDQASVPASSTNLYATNTGERPASAPVTEFVTTLPSRPKRVVTLGLVGLLLAAAGILIAAAGIVRSGDWSWGLSMGMSFQFLGLAASLPAWILGAADLKAMRSGAMERQGRRLTRIGCGLGVAGFTMGLVPFLLWIGVFVVI